VRDRLTNLAGDLAPSSRDLAPSARDLAHSARDLAHTGGDLARSNRDLGPSGGGLASSVGNEEKERSFSQSGPGPFASGRAPAHTVPLVRPQRRTAGRIAVVVALLAAAGVAVVIGSWSSPGDDDQVAPQEPPPASSEPAVTHTVTVEPELPPTSPPPPPSPQGDSRDSAVRNVTAAVEAGRSAGRIRDDVAVDLLNLLQQLGNAPAAEVPGRVDALQQKVRQRIGEGGLDAAQADVLRARLDEVKQT
jgi:hypothetical protein